MTLQRRYLSKSGLGLSVQISTAICSKPLISVKRGKLQDRAGGDLRRICHEREVHSVPRVDSTAPRLLRLSEESQLEGAPSNSMLSAAASLRKAIQALR